MGWTLTNQVAKILLRSHAATAWPIFSSALLGEDALLAHTIGRFLGRGLRGDATEGDFPLSEIDVSVFEAWLHDTPGAPVKAARMLRLIERQDGNIRWTRYGRLLIDEFGTNNSVLHAIASNLQSGVWWGPRRPFWREIAVILDKLDAHPFKEVREWTKDFKASLLSNIAGEQHVEDARSVGRWE